MPYSRFLQETLALESSYSVVSLQYSQNQEAAFVRIVFHIDNTQTAAYVCASLEGLPSSSSFSAAYSASLVLAWFCRSGQPDRPAV